MKKFVKFFHKLAKIKKCDTTFLQCRENSRIIDYVFKTEDLIRPYYSVEEPQ